jgi:hypothetical protein
MRAYRACQTCEEGTDLEMCRTGDFECRMGRRKVRYTRVNVDQLVMLVWRTRKEKKPANSK